MNPIKRTLFLMVSGAFLCLIPTRLESQDLPNEDWAETVNGASDVIANYYTDAAYHVNPDGSFVQGAENIAQWWQEQGIIIDSLAVIREIQPHVNTYRYQIMYLHALDGNSWKQLAIWNVQGEEPLLELEVVDMVAPVMNYKAQLEAQRQIWMTHCNAHQVSQLVNEVYAPNALYYNHDLLDVGRETIINTYQYMARPDYNLHLEPIIIEPVNEELAYEIGQCSGSYPGKYVLVWKKDETGKWHILLDSNI